MILAQVREEIKSNKMRVYTHWYVSLQYQKWVALLSRSARPFHVNDSPALVLSRKSPAGHDADVKDGLNKLAFSNRST